jgi:hypothetical protein
VKAATPATASAVTPMRTLTSFMVCFSDDS